MPHQCTGCGHVFPDGSKEMLSGCPDCGGNKFQFQPRGTGSDAAGGASDETAPAGEPADGGTAPSPPAPDEEPPEPPEPPGPGGSVAETVAGAAQSVRKMVGSNGGDRAADEATDREWPAVGREDAVDPTGVAEDSAQASARSGTVSPDELPDPTGLQAGASATDAGKQPSDVPGQDVDEPVDEARTTGADTSTTGGSAPFTGSGDREEQTPDLSELRAELNDQFESIKIVERGQYELNLMELYDREEYIISLMEDGRYAIEVPETWRGEP